MEYVIIFIMMVIILGTTLICAVEYSEDLDD